MIILIKADLCLPYIWIFTLPSPLCMYLGIFREVFITPSTLWGGQGLLGVSIRWLARHLLLHLMKILDFLA